MRLFSKNTLANLSVYGFAHAMVDLVCAAVIFSIFRDKIVDIPTFLNFVIIYNLLAFGLQSTIGLLVDYFKSPKLTAIIGCILVGTSALVFPIVPILAVIFAGLGNAIFHVGGGTISLNLTSKKASAPGIFVAPGAFGLFLGTVMGKGGYFVAWQAVLILLVLCILMFLIKSPEINYKRENNSKNEYFGLILILILLSIMIRSLVGFAVVFPRKVDFNLLIILTIAIVLGKAVGGILADKFGWIKVAVGALVLSIPLLTFASNIPALAILGMFLFNTTMPVTMVAISNLLPGRPAFAFGLTCLALMYGVLPTYLGLNLIIGTTAGIIITIIISSVALFYGLSLQKNK